jgi:hypothetical protein
VAPQGDPLAERQFRQFAGLVDQLTAGVIATASVVLGGLRGDCSHAAASWLEQDSSAGLGARNAMRAPPERPTAT